MGIYYGQKHLKHLLHILILHLMMSKSQMMEGIFLLALVVFHLFMEYLVECSL